MYISIELLDMRCNLCDVISLLHHSFECLLSVRGVLEGEKGIAPRLNSSIYWNESYIVGDFHIQGNCIGDEAWQS